MKWIMKLLGLYELLGLSLLELTTEESERAMAKYFDELEAERVHAT